MFTPTRTSSPLRRNLAIALLVFVSVATVRPAAAQSAPAAPPEGAPAPVYVQAPPAQIEMVHKPRVGLLVGGAVTFGISWGIAAFVSAVLLNGKNANNEDVCTGDCRNFAGVLWIPVAGPILADSRDPGSDGRAALIAWSVIQAAGVTMLAFGIAGHDVPVRRRHAQTGPTLQLLPMLARGASGMTLTARW